MDLTYHHVPSQDGFFTGFTGGLKGVNTNNAHSCCDNTKNWRGYGALYPSPSYTDETLAGVKDVRCKICGCKVKAQEFVFVKD